MRGLGYVGLPVGMSLSGCSWVVPDFWLGVALGLLLGFSPFCNLLSCLEQPGLFPVSPPGLLRGCPWSPLRLALRSHPRGPSRGAPRKTDEFPVTLPVGHHERLRHRATRAHPAERAAP